MKLINRAAAMAALSALLSGAAQAVTLYTAPASSGFASGLLGCRVTNLRSTPLSVVVEARSYAGTLAQSVPIALSPGHTDGLDISGAAYCDFVVSGSRSTVRASATYFTNTGVLTTAVPAK